MTYKLQLTEDEWAETAAGAVLVQRALAQQQPELHARIVARYEAQKKPAKAAKATEAKAAE